MPDEVNPYLYERELYKDLSWVRLLDNLNSAELAH